MFLCFPTAGLGYISGVAKLTLALHSIHFTQIIGAPLYFVNREWFYAYMAMTKRSFALTTAVMTHIWGSTTIRISGDETVAGQIKPTPGGGVQFNFPERMVLIANHQVCGYHSLYMHGWYDKVLTLS